MSSGNHHFIALDVGERRIGVAQADSETRFPFPVGTIDVDGLEMERLREIVTEVQPSTIIIGYPRNQHGEPTKQTGVIEKFAASLEYLQVPVIFQDESLTSVLAEEYLKRQKKPYTRADIDSHAATIILGDYLEQTYGH